MTTTIDSEAERLLFQLEVEYNREDQLERRLKIYAEDPATGTESLHHRLITIALRDRRERIAALKAQVTSYLTSQEEQKHEY